MSNIGDMDTDLRIADDTTQHDMEIDPESMEDISHDAPESSTHDVTNQGSNEAAEKSRIQKEAFLEMFRIAPRIKDVLPDLRIFMDHPDVIEWDRREVEHLVELKIQEEKAKKKAEKAARKEKELVEKAPVVGLADAIKSATGINVAGILQKLPPKPPISSSSPLELIPGTIVPIPGIPQGAIVMHARPEGLTAAHGASTAPILVTRLGPPPPKITSVGHGKCGFNTPHPNDIPPELRNAKPDLIAPIPDELRVLPTRGPQVAPIPNELLPLEQRVFEPLPIVFVRPPMRKTLYLAGARFGKRSERIQEQKIEGKKSKKKRKMEDSFESDNKKGRGGAPKKPAFSTGMNALPAGLNRNSPLAVKRYHARQLAKETGITLEEAMKEIEDQCAEFGGEDTPEAREHDEKAMELIKKRGEERFNQRYNYTPADHSKGIPGVDRPPAGYPKDRQPPPAPPSSREPIPGYDRPPVGYGRDEPGVDRPRRGPRGGVKEREKRRRREEMQGRGRGRGRGVGGGRGGYSDGYGGGGGGPSHGRYDTHEDYSAPRDRYGSGSYNVHATYDDQRAYDDYYGGHEAASYYDQYDGGYGQQGAGGGGGAEGSYEYDQHAAEAYYQAHEGQDATYYQEDGSQYYNEYYGTSSEGGGASGAEYHATFDPSAKPSEATPPA